eukprot:gene18047-24465_t
MSSKDVPGFYKAVWDFVLIIAVAAPLFSFNSWVEDRLVLAWRAYMTRYFLAAYFDNRAYFHLRQQGDDGDGLMIDNPDQRICVLWSVSSNLVVFMIVYALVGTVVTTAVFGKVLTKLYYKILSCEGDLRFSMVRVREFAESIAFYSGERQERQVVGNRLQQVVNVTVDRVVQRHSLATRTYGAETQFLYDNRVIIAWNLEERQERQDVGNRLQQVVNVTVDRVR